MRKLCLLATLLFVIPCFSQVRDGAADRDAAARFGEEMTRALNERDEKALTSLIDLHALAVRAAKVQGLSPGDEEKFVRALESAGLSRMAAGYFQRLNAGNGSAQFMRTSGGKEARALIRLDLGASGVDYLEYIVETTKGRARTVDWFQLSTGELVSTTVGGIAQMFSSNDPGMLGRLLGVQNVDKTALLNLQKVGDLQRQGKYAEALKVLQTLPPAISDSRIMLSVQASLAMLSKQDSEYARVLAKLAAKYSDDPAAAFKLVDHYFTTKDLPNMLRSLDTMEKRVGVDGVTRHLRAAAYCSTNDYTSCLRYADESCKLEPDRMAGYDVRATALVGLGRFPDAVAQYRDMEKGYGLQFTRAIFEEDPAFAKFVASPAFNGWLPK